MQALQTAGGTPDNVVVLAPAQADAFRRFRVSPGTAPLLALHAAIGRILQGSGAAAHIDRILADTAAEDLAADGQSHLGLLMQLRLDGWWDGGSGRGSGRGGGRGGGREGGSGDVWVETSTFTE